MKRVQPKRKMPTLPVTAARLCHGSWPIVPASEFVKFGTIQSCGEKSVRGRSAGKYFVIRVAYLAIFVLCAAALWSPRAVSPANGDAPAIPADAVPLAVLMVVSLILVNALAVTSLTNERDSRALDLLLVTDLVAKRDCVSASWAAHFTTPRK